MERSIRQIAEDTMRIEFNILTSVYRGMYGKMPNVNQEFTLENQYKVLLNEVLCWIEIKNDEPLKEPVMSFRNITREAGLINGQYGCYKFWAKVEAERAKDGINKGKVTKLEIRHVDYNRYTISYDKEWISLPKSVELFKIYEKILRFLEKFSAKI